MNIHQLMGRALAARLDARLAAGYPPGMSRLLAARADDLVSPRSRQALARYWDRLLLAASEPRPLLSAAVPPSVDAVRDALPEIQALQARLVARRPVDVRGVALARELLTDGAGPAYRTNRETLAIAVRGAREALELDPLVRVP